MWSKTRFYFTLEFTFSKFKLSISSAKHVLHIEMCLETKFYIFWNFFTIFKQFLKISFWYEQFFNSDFTVQTLFIHCSDFQKSFINSKKIPKNVKFSFQAHFDMENTLSTWNRQFEFWKHENQSVARRARCNRLYISLSLMIIYYIIKNRDFQKSERNSKIFSKNVKFGLQAHFNMENMLRT